MRSTLLAAVALIILLIPACSRMEEALDGPILPTMTQPFDPDAAAYVLALGTGTITGQALYRGGETPIYGVLARVRLFPVTAYSSEYFGHLFQGGSTFTSARQVENVNVRFTEFMRQSQADDQGKFVMYGIPAGDFYLYTIVVGEGVHGAGVYKRISLVEGQTLEVILDGT